MQRAKSIKTHRKQYPDQTKNFLHLFDHQQNVYIEQQLQQKKRIDFQPVKTYDNTTVQRFIQPPEKPQRQRSTTLMDTFVDFMKKEESQLPRQVSHKRSVISSEIPLMTRKRSVSPQLSSNNIHRLMTDTIDYGYEEPKKGIMMVKQSTPKFSELRGLKTFPSQSIVDPITQGVDYRDLNTKIKTSTSPLRRHYKLQDGTFFKNGFEIFQEPTEVILKVKRDQRSDRLRDLVFNQENHPPPSQRPTLIKDFRGDQIQKILNDNSIIAPKQKNIKDWRSDVVPKLIKGELPAAAPKQPRQNLNIFHPEKSRIEEKSLTPQQSSRSLIRNASQNMRNILEYR